MDNLTENENVPGRLCGPVAGPLVLTVESASYAARGAGARIAYTLTPTPCGLILLAATNHGVAWLGIHDSAVALEAELRNDLSYAELIDDPERAGPYASQVVAAMVGDTSTLDLPMDIRATAFQLRVWRALCASPRGATRTYGEIARDLGQPQGSRAVGCANGSNPAAIIIPCHRVIGADGGLTGYRWGVEYKRRLLQHEGALAAAASCTSGEAAIDHRVAFRLELPERIEPERNLRRS
jgi:AraC family transcriptional regulator, regulatory protein of adaptative response / methylated-DNA-[protein]-cysteine methyltransferase